VEHVDRVRAADDVEPDLPVRLLLLFFALGRSLLGAGSGLDTDAAAEMLFLTFVRARGGRKREAERKDGRRDENVRNRSEDERTTHGRAFNRNRRHGSSAPTLS